MTVADYIAEFLVSKGVRHVFGFQGSAMLKMLDAMVATGKIEYIQNFHEQASAFAADAYARVHGMPGVAIATSGPGAANLMTGVANAYFDSVPVLFLTGQDRRAHVCARRKSRQNGFQDMDVVAMARKITKRAVQVLDPKSLTEELDRCWRLAQKGRKGPVLIDIPMDLQFEQMPDSAVSIPRRMPIGNNRVDMFQLDSAIEALNSAKRPVALVGGGVRLAGACGLLDSFAHKTRIPVVSTLMGLDATKETLGFSGVYGNPLPNKVLRESDCILALGTRFAFHQTGRSMDDYAPRAKVVHVDVDETELGRVCRDAACVRADVATFLRTAESCGVSSAPAEWLARIRRWRGRCGGRPAMFPARFLDRLFDEAPPDATFAADVGSSQMWVAQRFVATGRNRLLNSGGLGAMGFSLPAAIGASYVSEVPAVSICGDGGFQMNLQELNTLALRRRNVKVFVFDNSSLGLMRGIQRNYYGSRFVGNSRCEFSCPKICQLASAYGLKTIRIERDVDFDGIGKVFSDHEPWLVDVVVDEDEIARSRYEAEVLE